MSSANDVIYDAQFGFEPRLSTIDAKFALHRLIQVEFKSDFSVFFSSTRGAMQGDTLSPFIFVIHK